jgi:hypothetical protein
MLQLRAAALEGRFAEVPELWRELLARDFVGYAGALDKPKDLTALRSSPEWQRVRAIEAGIRGGYAAGLGGEGVFFVARSRAAKRPDVAAGATAKLALAQEAYHYDPKTGRYRRLTETGGQVYALSLSVDRKTLAFVTVPALARLDGGALALGDPQLGLITLATLETSGPAPLGPSGTRVRTVTMCASTKGEALWLAVDGAGTESAQLFDSTGTTVVKAEGERCAPDQRVEVSALGIELRRPDPPRVRLSEAGDLLELEGADKPIRPARPVNPRSISWSPGGKRLAYAGVLDPCRPPAKAAPAAASKAAGKAAGKKGDAGGNNNELYVWDGEKKRPQRIASAVAFLDSVWLDDDHLVYEGGVDGAARLLIFDATTGKSVPLKARAGAGLHGVPTGGCEVHPGTTETETEDATDVEADEPSEGGGVGETGQGGAPG